MAGISSKAAGTIENKYKSNGGTELESKEFSDGSGLDWLSTDFRSYDAQIGRFHQIDFLASLSFNQSPYAFVNNNPINFIDPLGLDTLNMVNGKFPTTRPDGSALKENDVILNGNGSIEQTFNGEGWQQTKKLDEVIVSGSPKSSTPKSSSNDTQLDIRFGDNANQKVVTERSINILKDIMKESGNPSITITSTQRTPQDQARAMYNNIISSGVQYILNLYGSNGDRVVNVAASARRKGQTRDEVLAAMIAEIRRIGPSRVSRHCGDPNVLNVLDISPGSLQNRKAFVREVRERGIFLLQPPADPGYHVGEGKWDRTFRVMAYSSMEARRDFASGGMNMYGGAGRAAKALTTAEQTTTTALAKYWPSNGGALGNWYEASLLKGARVDRIGGLEGSYLAPYGTPFSMRALPANGTYHAFEVMKPFQVQTSTTAPAFGQMGLGTQYRTPISIQYLIDFKYLKPIK